MSSKYFQTLMDGCNRSLPNHRISAIVQRFEILSILTGSPDKRLLLQLKLMLSPILASITLLTGILIGGVGIGGVLLVPALKFVGGIPLHTAIPACMVAYVMTGIVGAIIFARHGTINWSLAKTVCIGALPGAFIGASILPYISAAALEVAIALLLLASGIDSLRKTRQPTPAGADAPVVELAAIGLITGIGSALTGTGGPLMLIPVLLWRGIPVLTAIGLAQVIQIPIALMATAGNVMAGNINIRLGLGLAVLLGIGAIIGARFAHTLPLQTLKTLVSWLLVVVGSVLLYRLVF